MEPSSGAVVNGMLLVERLGEGGMGEVWRAEYLGTQVAVKFLKGSEAQRSFAMEAIGQYRLSKESAPDARYFARIEHYEPSGERPHLRMELVQGQSLGQALANGPLPFDQALSIMEHLLHALSFAHGRGFVHGDLKPQNVILTTAGDVPLKVIDCGFGYAMDRSLSPTDLDRSYGQGQRSMSLGVSTTAYCAPERFTRAFIDRPDIARSCDVYALGKILYQMLTGDAPATVFPLEGRVPGATRAIDQFIVGCLENRWEYRWKSAREALEALANARKGVPAAAPPTPAAPPAPGAPPSPTARPCASCGAAFPPEARFCPRCGRPRAATTEPAASVAVRCDVCETSNAAGTRYCIRCGALVAVTKNAGAWLRALAWVSLVSACGAAIWVARDVVNHLGFSSWVWSGGSRSERAETALGFAAAWLASGLLSWAIFAWVLRRPPALLRSSCAVILLAAAGSLFCLQLEVGERSRHDRQNLAHMGSLTALIGYWILTRRREAWFARWRT